MSGTPRTQTKTKTNLTHQPCCDDEFPPSPPTPLPQKPEPTNPFIFATGELGEEAMTDEDSGRHLPTYCGWVSPPKPGLPTNKITKRDYAVNLYYKQTRLQGRPSVQAPTRGRGWEQGQRCTTIPRPGLEQAAGHAVNPAVGLEQGWRLASHRGTLGVARPPSTFSTLRPQEKCLAKRLQMGGKSRGCPCTRGRSGTVAARNYDRTLCPMPDMLSARTNYCTYKCFNNANPDGSHNGCTAKIAPARGLNTIGRQR